MHRYNSTPTKKVDGITVHQTVSLPKLVIDDNTPRVVYPNGTRLYTISNREYGTPDLHWVIAHANGLAGKASWPGGECIVPDNITEIITEYNVLNSINE